MSPIAWRQWGEARPPSTLLHLDHAAVGRSSQATLDAVSTHARLEAEAGGYVAEQRAQPCLDALRADVAGLLGTDPDGVAFLESGTAALQALVDAWPLPEGARVAVAPAEWGPDLEILEHRGLRAETLDVDSLGVVDLAALEARLRDSPPELLLVDQVAAHRGLVQPAEAMVALGRAFGVPVWVDAAQAVGQLPVAAADAVFGTSRKWLTGPRGVGMLAIAAQHRDTLRLRRAAKYPDRPPVRHLESEEAHVAGRVGLAVAVRECLDLGIEQISRRLVEVGRLTREAVESVDGWEVLHPEAPAGAITALVATAGQDVAATRQRLLDQHAIVTSICHPWRAPREVPHGTGPWLRLSPHVDLTGADLDRLCEALR